MPHARTDAPKRKRKPPPSAPASTTYLPHGGPVHDTPPNAPAPTYGPGRITPPTNTLDQILSYGAGPLNLPAGKIALPQRSHAPPQIPMPPQFFAAGARQPPAPVAPQHVSLADLARAQAAIDAADARVAGQPGYIQRVAHDSATLQSLLPIASALPGTQLRELLGALNSAPAQERDAVFANLPQIDPGLKTAVQAVRDYSAPHGFFQHVEHNFLPDMLRTPQGIFLGGYQLARAAGQALPSASIGPQGVNVQSGDPTALEQAANEMVAPLAHPIQFAQDNPFQALISLSGVGRAAGAATGAAGRAGLLGDNSAAALSGTAAREITSPIPSAIAGTDSSPILRTIQDGTYSKNAWEQLFQRLRDTHASHSTGAFDRRVNQQGQQLLRRREALKNANTRQRINPVIEATRGANKDERIAAVYAGGSSGQGLRPSDLIKHYQQRLYDLRQQLPNATGVDRGRVKRDIGYATQALTTWKRVRARVGDDVTPAMHEIQGALSGSLAQREAELQSLGLLDPAQAAAARAQPQGIVIPGEARPAAPFYVRHAPLQRNLAHPMRAPRRSTSILAAREGTSHTRTGALLRSGNLDLSLRPQIERLAQPGDAAAAAHFLNDLRAAHGVHVSPGDTFDPAREQLISATTNATAAMKDGYDVLRENTPQQHSTGLVPAGDWVLVPKPLYDKRVAEFAPQDQGAFGRYGHAATNAFRWYALSARPAWLASNVVGNTAQAILGGVGPISAYRGLKRDGRIGKHLPGQDYTAAIPATVPYGGLLTQMLKPKRGFIPRSDRLPQNPLRLANVTTENWARRALYLRHAIPEYGHDINDLINAKTVEERAPKVVKIVDRFLGSFGHGKGRYTAAVPFFGWLWFITKHTLYSLPVHHPMRGLLLARLGDLGNAASDYEGLLNQSLQGAIPAGGGDQGPVGPTTNFIRTGSLNPWATVTQLAGFDPRNPTGQPNLSGALGAINPFLQTAYGAATGHELNSPQFTGPATLTPQDRAAYVFGQLLNTVPFTRVIDPRLRIGQPPAAQPQQPAPSLLQRLLGYNLVGVTPVDTQLMNIKNIRGLIANLKAQARQ